MSELKAIQQLIDHWAYAFSRSDCKEIIEKYAFSRSDCEEMIEKLAIRVAIHLDDSVSEIFYMIHKANFPEKSKVDCVYALIHAVNKCGMDYITALDATGEPTKEKQS